MHVSLIDRFFIPANARSEFQERMHLNRSLIRTLPGFIRDDVYEAEDEKGNLNCVTIAIWNTLEDIVNAKEAVQAEYLKEGFDMPAMLKRLDIVIDRGVYSTATTTRRFR